MGRLSAVGRGLELSATAVMLGVRMLAVALAASAVAAGPAMGQPVTPPQIHSIAGGGSCSTGIPLPGMLPPPPISGGPCDGVSATSVSISTARSVAALPGGGFLYIDYGYDLVREVMPNGKVFTVAGDGTTTDRDGGLAISSGLNGPVSVAPLSGGGFLITEYQGSVVRLVSPGTPQTATITTIAGTGTPGSAGGSFQATSTQLNYPSDAEPTPNGGVLIADTYNNDIKLLSAAAPGATVITIAGSATPTCNDSTTDCDGLPAASVGLYHPVSVSALPSGSGYLIAEYGTDAIREVSDMSQLGTFSTVAGTAGVPGYSGDGGLASAALLNHPEQVVATADGGYLIADSGNNVIRQVSPTGTISTVVGNGTAGYAGDGGDATAASLLQPAAVSQNPDGTLLIADADNNVIRATTIAPTTTFSTFPAVPTGKNGWFVSDVDVETSATQGAKTSCSLNPSPPPPSFIYLYSPCQFSPSGSLTTDGVYVLYAASINSYGDMELPVSFTVKVDKTPPTVACVKPAPTFTLNKPYQLVTASVTDATSGPIASRVSARAHTSTSGRHTVTLTGLDYAGHHTTVKCGYTVTPGRLSPTPRVTSRFARGRGYAAFGRLIVRDVPAHAAVDLACQGGGCPFSYANDVTGKECRGKPCIAKRGRGRTARRTVDLTRLFGHSRLGRGASVLVSVTEPNRYGRAWLFTFRGRLPPTVVWDCIAPNSSALGENCVPQPPSGGVGGVLAAVPPGVARVTRR